MLEKNFWKVSIRHHMRRHSHHHENNDGIATTTDLLTLKASVPRNSVVDLLLLSSPPRFVPQFQPLITPSVDTEAVVRYDSRRGIITFEYKQILRSLTLAEYGWIMRELHQEERLSPSSSVRLSRVVAIMSNSISLQNRRHSIKTMVIRPKMALLLLVPKTLLLRAATHIPMSKPLPPPVHCIVPSSFDGVPEDMYDRLSRYIQIATLPSHDMHHTTLLHVGMMCRRCFTRMGNGSEAVSALEVVASSSSTWSDDDDDDDDHRQRRRQQQKRRTSAFATATVHPPTLTAKRRPLSTSPVASAAPQQQQHQCGYTLCVDRDKEEIIVAFGYDSPPKPFLLHHLHDGVSVVPWSEGGWVLEWAAAQWRQVEMPVATALMRLCRTTPAHYRVVLVGFQWGGALAALCASSLVITGLLTRHVTLCVVDAPRTGSVEFIERLQKYKIETIRVLRLSDPHSLWPPRTAGLCHLGETTMLWINNTSQPKMLKSKRCWEEIEDELAKLYRAIKLDATIDHGGESKSTRSSTHSISSSSSSSSSRISRSNSSTSTHTSTHTSSHSQQRDSPLGIPLCCRMRKIEKQTISSFY